MATRKLNGRGQVTIPADVRADLKVESGDWVHFNEVDSDRSETTTVTQSVKALKGIVKSKKVVSVEQMNDTVAEVGAKQG